MLLLSGGPVPGSTRTASGKIYVFARASLTGKPVAEVATLAGGRFRVNLPAGTYYLAATSPSFAISPEPAMPPCRADKSAHVPAGSTVNVTVVCAMK